jgi:hypothetical protein
MIYDVPETGEFLSLDVVPCRATASAQQVSLSQEVERDPFPRVIINNADSMLAGK